MGFLANYYIKANDKVSARSCFLKELNSAKSYQEILKDIYRYLKGSERVAKIALYDKFLALPDSVPRTTNTQEKIGAD